MAATPTNSVGIGPSAVAQQIPDTHKVGSEQLVDLMSRGLSDNEAAAMIVNGIEPIVEELPMEYAVEMNRLIQLQMEGAVGSTR